MSVIFKPVFGWSLQHMFYAVSESTGSIIWSYRLTGAVEGRCGAVANRRVFVADHWDQKLYAFGTPYNPTASFTWSPPMPRATKTVTFDASGSTPNAGTIVSYTWDFGDGNITTTTSPSITHRYSVSERYNVTLTVLNSVGLTGSVTERVKITHLADVDMDGAVDVSDLALVVAAFGSYPGKSGWNPACDMNEDNIIDVYDVAYVCHYFGWHDP
jgi:PKD repeat protein